MGSVLHAKEAKARSKQPRKKKKQEHSHFTTRDYEHGEIMERAGIESCRTIATATSSKETRFVQKYTLCEQGERSGWCERDYNGCLDSWHNGDERAELLHGEFDRH